MKGTAVSCARDFKERCGRDFGPLQKFAAWSGASYDGSVLYWFAGKYAPYGVNLLKFWVFLELVNYRVVEFQKLGPVLKILVRVIAHDILSIDDVTNHLCLTKDSVFRILQGRGGMSRNTEVLVKELSDKYWKEVEEREGAFRQELEGLTAKKSSLVEQAAPVAPPPVPQNSSMKHIVIQSLASQVNAMIPLAERMASDEFSPADREELRRLAGQFSVFNLKNALIQLCGERARETNRRGGIK